MLNSVRSPHFQPENSVEFPPKAGKFKGKTEEYWNGSK